MDAQVKAIQERLRAKMSQPMEVGERAMELPIVSFEDVAGIPDGAETLVHRVVRALRERGHRVACLRRFGPDNVPDAAAQVGGSYIDAGACDVVFAMPGKMMTAQPVAQEPTFDQMLGALGGSASYDVVVAESFGYLPLPKVLVTRKVQEGFNLGLPNVVAYVSGKSDDAMVIPFFEPGDAEGLAAFIERKIMGIEAAPEKVPHAAAPEEAAPGVAAEEVPSDASGHAAARAAGHAGAVVGAGDSGREVGHEGD